MIRSSSSHRCVRFRDATNTNCHDVHLPRTPSRARKYGSRVLLLLSDRSHHKKFAQLKEDTNTFVERTRPSSTMMRKVDYHRSHTLPDGFRLSEIQPSLVSLTSEYSDHSHPDNDEVVPTPKNDSTAGSHTAKSSASGEDHDNALKTTNNVWGRGIVKDFSGTIKTNWKQEMSNFNLKTIAVSFFLFFACIAPAITFGAIYEKATHNWMGAVEMITATAWCGIVYAIFGGQPMMINGGTGPVLAFAEILYKMSTNMDVPFLTLNAWIGLWVAFYMFLAAFFDLNRILVYATRFTDEIFSFLISTIFIVNALGSPFAPVGIYYYFVESHKSHDEFEDDVEYYSYEAMALLSLLVFFGTVYLAFTFRKAKFSPYFPSQVIRNLLTDFAVVISIFLMCIVANWVFQDIETERLNVPDSFAPTYACCDADCNTNWPDDCPDKNDPYQQRPWLVNLFDLNGKTWVPFVAALPAILAFILVFLDDGITWHLINHPTHKLTHGAAYNYDTIVLGIMIAVNSLLGLPWLVAATVRSLNHVHALATKSPEGKILSVQETRLTHLGIHLLCFASIFALDVLKLIPVPVLYGVFLFMGLVSLGTNQFWGRLLMTLMQPSRYPQEPYVEHVEPRSMHRFTLIQLGLFVLLYTVKSIKTIAIAFPIVIALCIPFRVYVLPMIFTEEELIMLDSDETAIQSWLAAKEKVADHGSNLGENLADDSGPCVVSDLPDLSPDDDEHRDYLAPLPMLGDSTASYASSSTTPPRRRKSRIKSVSCPTNGSLFGENFPIEVRIKAHAQDHIETTEVAEVSEIIPDEEVGGTASLRRRRRRHKTVSCPPHMLFMEAERHMNENYFFG